MTLTSPICVALDTPDVAQAKSLARALQPYAGLMKIGMEFFYANGAAGYETVAAQGLPIFLDLKLHDIPNTVAQGLASLMQLKPRPAIVNIHAQGGLDMMKAARDAVGDKARLVAVTILTSLSNQDIVKTGLNPNMPTDAHALNLARLAHDAGLDGVVCSPHDLVHIRSALPRGFLTVVPGIRPDGSAAQDQKRIATPKAASAAGADILVIGRAITGADDPVIACRTIAEGLIS
jgi:orotidine-5'-phosphate decarboxylase